MVDQGNVVSYDKLNDRSILKSAGSERIYSFGRKQVSGSEGRFYVCRMKKQSVPTNPKPPADEITLIETASENVRRYTKREVEAATRAREMLSKMGFSQISQAISIANVGRNFDITAEDYAIAEAIWGSDIASMKGKTVKHTTKVADVSIGKILLQEKQISSVDIMFVEGLPSLIDLALLLSAGFGLTRKRARR